MNATANRPASEAMQLSVEGNVSDEPVTAELIAKTVASMAIKGDFFLILSRDELTYIQTSGSTETGFVLEYQDGSIEKHYSCTDTQLSASQVVEALQRYLNDHDRWKNDFTWEHLDLGSPARGLKGKTILSALVIVAAIVIAGYLAST